MRKVFIDDHLEQEFSTKGFVVVSFLQAEDIPEIKEKLLSLKPSDNYKGLQKTLLPELTFHTTFFDSNRAYKSAIFDLVNERFKGFADETLDNYNCVQANVFLKPSGKGYVHPHQNLTIVDESEYRSLSFWMPLQDTNVTNGTIHLVPGSQGQFIKYRNTHIYWPYIPFFQKEKGLSYMQAINVKAGELLILDDSIIHFTPDNQADHDRWVLHSLWKPTEAPVLFCDPKENEVDIYQVEDDFWQYQVPGNTELNIKPNSVVANNEVLHSEEELVAILDKLS